MTRTDARRTHLLNFRVSPSEFAELKNRFEASLCRSMSDYVRTVVLDSLQAPQLEARVRRLEDQVEGLLSRPRR